MGASHRQVCMLERRCHDAGMKMTTLRRVVLHGVLEAGSGATAVDIWRILLAMMEGHAPSPASLQRTLHMMVELGILCRRVGIDRTWHYDVMPTRKKSPAILLVDAGTGTITPCNDPEMTTLLKRLAARRGLALQEASITVTALVDKTEPAHTS